MNLAQELKDFEGSQPYPGPWEVHYADDGAVWVVETSTPERLVVCDIPGDMETIEGEQLANAHLIAAAPDYKAACLQFLAAMEMDEAGDPDGAVEAAWQQAVDLAEAAIEKERGADRE